MHMPSLHRRHRVLARGCTEATSRARWAHCPRWAAVSPHSARGAHSCHAARRGISGRFDLSRAVVRRACRRGHAGALRPLCSAPACPAFSPIAQAHQPHRWGGSGALFGCTGRTCARARCCNVRIGEKWPTYGWTKPTVQVGCTSNGSSFVPRPAMASRLAPTPPRVSRPRRPPYLFTNRLRLSPPQSVMAIRASCA